VFPGVSDCVRLTVLQQQSISRIKRSKMPTFKEIFSIKDRTKGSPSRGSPSRASPTRGSPEKPRSPERRMGPQELLSSSQSLLQRLRMMQPGDEEAFPMLNECTRLSKHTVPLHTA
jgi:hypothetical protein